MERKLARLRREVAEVKDEFERRKEKPRENASQETRDETASLDTLSHLLDSVGSTTTDGEASAASRLTRRLASVSRPNGHPVDGKPAESAQQDRISSTYTVTYAPKYQEDHTLSKVSDFDSRLALIEAALGIDTIPLPTQDRSTSKAVIPTLNSLDKQLTTLSTSTDSSLDTISRRVRQLTHDAEKLELARKLQRQLTKPSNKKHSVPRAKVRVRLPQVARRDFQKPRIRSQCPKSMLSTGP